MDAAGRILKRARVPSSPSGLRAALGEYREPMKAVLEASYSWGPIYDWLDEIVDDVVLAHPQKIRAIAEARIKTDAIDSVTLAHLLRADLIPEAHAPSKEVRAIKRGLRQRMFFVRVQTMVKNRIHALFAQLAIALPDVSDLFGKAGLRWLQTLTLPEPDRHLLNGDPELLRVLQARIATTDQWIADLGNGDDVVRCPIVARNVWTACGRPGPTSSSSIPLSTPVGSTKWRSTFRWSNARC